jgi:hypothetical protein
MFDTAPPSSRRPPPSSRSHRRLTHESVSVTADSSSMKELLSTGLKHGKLSRGIPLIVHSEEIRESGSVGRRWMQRIARSRLLQRARTHDHVRRTSS